MSALKDVLSIEIRSGLASPRAFDLWIGPRTAAIADYDVATPSRRVICKSHDFTLCRRSAGVESVQVVKQCQRCGVVHNTSRWERVDPSLLPECNELFAVAATEAINDHRQWTENRARLLTTVHFGTGEKFIGNALDAAQALNVPERVDDCTSEQLGAVQEKMISDALTHNPTTNPHEVSLVYERRQYLASAVWQRTTERVISQAEQGCQCCGAPATLARHLMFTNLGRENDAELLALCEDCDALIDDLQSACLPQAAFTHEEVGLLHRQYRAFRRSIEGIWRGLRWSPP